MSSIKDFLDYANRQMDKYLSEKYSDNLFLCLARTALDDFLSAGDENPDSEFDRGLLRLINLYRTSRFAIEDEK